ncbi:MAG TPA: HEAT repeat domain-containing protein [Blastocatellia bacterium]|nr:HEAT repeat domain-containing protein [Blastocatellia bacterium]
MPEDEIIQDQNGELAGNRPSRKYPWAIVVVIALFVIIPFISWYGTWFGRPLSDAKMDQYLHDRNKPRNVQHALAQISQRIIAGDQTVKRWYPAIIEAAGNDLPEVRLTAAWVMGQDNAYQDFHATLGPMLSDSNPGVRHNAALALVRFGDASARSELVEMLLATTLHAPVSGTVELLVKDEGAPLAAGAPLVRLKKDDGQVVEMRAPQAGRIESIAIADNSKVIESAELMTLSPESEQVRSALVALYMIGQPEDIPAIQRYTRPSQTLPDSVEKQAQSTIEAIRGRAEKR